MDLNATFVLKSVDILIQMCYNKSYPRRVPIKRRLLRDAFGGAGRSVELLVLGGCTAVNAFEHSVEGGETRKAYLHCYIGYGVAAFKQKKLCCLYSAVVQEIYKGGAAVFLEYP